MQTRVRVSSLSIVVHNITRVSCWGLAGAADNYDLLYDYECETDETRPRTFCLLISVLKTAQLQQREGAKAERRKKKKERGHA